MNKLSKVLLYAGIIAAITSVYAAEKCDTQGMPSVPVVIPNQRDVSAPWYKELIDTFENFTYTGRTDVFVFRDGSNYALL